MSIYVAFRIVPVCASLALLASAVQGQPPAESKDDALTVATDVNKFLDAAFNAHKHELVAERYTEDADVMTFINGRIGQRYQGRPAIVRELARLFRVSPTVKSHATVLSAHYINPDTLVVDGVSDVTDPAGADSPSLRWAFTNVFVKSHSRWLMHTSRSHRVDVRGTAARPPGPAEQKARQTEPDR
jgi:uncharacterized protein (TIGR02246 family)